MDSSHYCLRAPTREIRLLDLISANGLGHVEGRIRRTTIGNAPAFVAVSHVWGERRSDRNIHLDSGCGFKLVQISSNLEALFTKLLSLDPTTLPQLWKNGSRLPLWVDMVCINQIDVGEKALQIPLMRSIYSQASSVIIWINEKDSFVHDAFRYLRQIAANPEVAESERTTHSGLFDPKGWESIKHLLNCEWFRRRWVLQETVVSKDAVFVSESEVMSINDLFRGVDIAIGGLLARPRDEKILHVAHVGSVRPVLALKELKKRYANADHPLTLLWLLERFRLTKTTLAHDQIYSLLGLCSPEETTGNPVRYDLEPEDAYRAFVASHARLHSDLEFLGLCTPAQRDNLRSGPLHSPSSRPFAGPSWVPNWHSGLLRRCLGLNSFDPNLRFFKAADRIPVTMSFQGNELVVSGVRVDRIESLGNFCSSKRQPEFSDANSRIFQQYLAFWTTKAERSMPYRDKKHLAETFARTVSLLGIYLDPVPSPIDIPAMFYRWCSGSLLGNQLAEYGLEPNEATRVDGQKLFIRMKRLLSWEPFVTDRGYIGLSREQSHVGDEIWLIGGSSVPILLSPLVGTPGSFAVNGEVFLDGFMFGETACEDIAGATLAQQITLV